MKPHYKFKAFYDFGSAECVVATLTQHVGLIKQGFSVHSQSRGCLVLQDARAALEQRAFEAGFNETRSSSADVRRRELFPERRRA